MTDKPPAAPAPDLCARLREIAAGTDPYNGIFDEAAFEIERLRALLDKHLRYYNGVRTRLHNLDAAHKEKP